MIRTIVTGMLLATGILRADVVTLDLSPFGPDPGATFIGDYFSGGTAVLPSGMTIGPGPDDGISSGTGPGGAFVVGSAIGRDVVTFPLHGSGELYSQGFSGGFSVRYEGGIFPPPGIPFTNPYLNLVARDSAGDVLGQTALQVNTGGSFLTAGFSFSGTATEVDFGYPIGLNADAGAFVYDEITFGSADPGSGTATPEPSTWVLFGLAFVIGWLLLRTAVGSVADAGAKTSLRTGGSLFG